MHADEGVNLPKREVPRRRLTRVRHTLAPSLHTPRCAAVACVATQRIEICVFWASFFELDARVSRPPPVKSWYAAG